MGKRNRSRAKGKSKQAAPNSKPTKEHAESSGGATQQLLGNVLQNIGIVPEAASNISSTEYSTTHRESTEESASEDVTLPVKHSNTSSAKQNMDSEDISSPTPDKDINVPKDTVREKGSAQEKENMPPSPDKLADTDTSGDSIMESSARSSSPIILTLSGSDSNPSSYGSVTETHKESHSPTTNSFKSANDSIDNGDETHIRSSTDSDFSILDESSATNTPRPVHNLNTHPVTLSYGEDDADMSEDAPHLNMSVEKDTDDADSTHSDTRESPTTIVSAIITDKREPSTTSSSAGAADEGEPSTTSSSAGAADKGEPSTTSSSAGEADKQEKVTASSENISSRQSLTSHLTQTETMDNGRGHEDANKTGHEGAAQDQREMSVEETEVVEALEKVVENAISETNPEDGAAGHEPEDVTLPEEPSVSEGADDKSGAVGGEGISVPTEQTGEGLESTEKEPAKAEVAEQQAEASNKSAEAGEEVTGGGETVTVRMDEHGASAEMSAAGDEGGAEEKGKPSAVAADVASVDLTESQKISRAKAAGPESVEPGCCCVIA